MRGSLKDDKWFAENFPSLFEAFPDGATVSKRNAVKISAVYTCLNILGETFGSLPFDVKQDTATGRKTRKDHPVYKLIHDRPNPYTTAFDFWSTQVKLIKAWGNAYAFIERGADGNPSALHIIHPQDVKIYRHTTGEVVYHVTKTNQWLPYTEVLHFKNFSLDGITGLSAIDENRVTIGSAKKLKDYNNSLIGQRPYGYLTAPTPPKDQNTVDNMKGMWTGKNKTGTTQVGDIPLLYGGLEFKALTLPADAVAYIESSELTEQDIYGIFRIPPTLAQNYKRATFSNAEQQDLVFSKYSLAMRTAIEQECNYKLFPESNYQSNEPYYCKFNLKGILAGDIKTRTEFYRLGLTLGLFSQNDVLQLEDMEGFEGGDRRYIQGAMIPLDMVDEFIRKGGKASPAVSEEKRSKLKSILNGHYQHVIDILDE